MIRLSILFLLLSIAACTQKRAVYFFGDSITQGARATSSERRWTTVLSNRKGWKEINYGASGELIDSTGFPTFLSRYRRLINIKSANDLYIFFAYGTNDANYNDGFKTVETFKKSYSKVIQYAIDQGWPDSSIVLIPGYYIANFSPWKKFPSDSLRHEVFVRSAEELAAQYHISCINPEKDMEAQGGKALLSDDGVHPSDSGYAVIGRYISEKLP
jgi:lysophospholipase L1-like esterase